MTEPNNNQQIEQQVREFISRNMLYSSGEFPHSDDASFLQEGIIDSFGVMELVEFVQSSFRVTVDQREVTPDNFDSVRKLAAFVRRKLGTVGNA
jgi:acyl carrier protein